MQRYTESAWKANALTLWITFSVVFMQQAISFQLDSSLNLSGSLISLEVYGLLWKVNPMILVFMILGGAVSDKSWSEGEDSWWTETMACGWLGSYLKAEKGEKIKTCVNIFGEHFSLSGVLVLHILDYSMIY